VTRTGILLAVLVAVGMACSLGGPVASPLPSMAGPTATAAPSTPRPTEPTQTEHRIALRQGNQGAEFYDVTSGERFIPRGFNYNRWVYRDSPVAGRVLVAALFNTEWGQLDQAGADLRQMADLGFNTLRVWKNACWGEVGGCLGEPAGGLSDDYLDNVVQFLHLAKQHDFVVIFTDDWVPDDGGYSQRLQHGCCDTFDGYNTVYLTEDGIAAEQAYIQDFIQGLIDRNAPLEAILAYELRNEAFYESNLAPFANASGTVTTANGQRYDMSSEADRQRMMEEGWLYYSQRLRQAILELDPTALVTMGFFVQHGPNPVRQDDPRTVILDRMIRESELDFIDLHAYPGYDLNMRQHAENFTIIGEEGRPLLLGEFGADKNNYGSADSAALALAQWQAASCTFGIDGWLMWSWDSPDFWGPLEGEGQIGQALAPRNFPDPCTTATADANLALAANASASASEGGDYAPGKAIDGSLGTWWSAGDGPPQWLEVDLGQAHDIGRIVLQPGWVSATGRQRISVSVRGPGTGGEYVPFHTFDVAVEAEVPIEYAAASPVSGIRWVRFETQVANGWVIWHELEVYSE